MATLFQHPDGSESPLIPPDLALLVSDSLEAPATFFIVQHLTFALKAKKRCILVGLAQSFDHYAALLRKQSIQLPNERERGSFVYIDAAKLLVEDEDPIASIHQAIKANLSESSLIFIDDFASFLYAGLDPVKLLKGFRSIRSSVRKHNGSMLVVYHDDAFSPGRANIERSEEDHFLLRNLIQLSDVWIQTRSLRAQLTGELVVHRAPSLVGQPHLATHSVNRPLQYKLEETGPTYFAKGTGKGFL